MKRLRLTAAVALLTAAGAGCACTPQPANQTDEAVYHAPETVERLYTTYSDGCTEVQFDGLGLDYRGASTTPTGLGEWHDGGVLIGYATAEDSTVWTEQHCAVRHG